MNPNAYHQPRMLSLGRRGKFGSLGRNKVIPKVLFLSLLAYFAYNSFDNSSVEIYRQLYEAAGDAPSESSGKVDGKFKYCRTPYVLMGHLMTTVPEVIPPKDRMNPPSHVQLCKALLDRSGMVNGNAESLPTILVKEDPAVCVDWSAAHFSAQTIFGSSLIAAKGKDYGLRYSHNCHQFLTHTREGNTHYDYTTVQEVLPENLISANDAASVDLDLVKDLCSRCITENAEERPEGFDATTNHCLLFPGGATAEDMVEKKHELPLASILSSFVDRMRHMSNDWIDATNAIKNEGDSGVIVSLDANSKFMDFQYYNLAIPFTPTSIQIFASANCAAASIKKKSNCIEHGRALKAHFKQRFPTVYVRYDIVASTATSFARMMNVKILTCPPKTINCILPALAKLAGKKAFIADDGSDPQTSHWFQKLIEKRKELGLFRVGFDPVSDEDFLVISEQASMETMPEDLPLDELDTEASDVPSIEGPRRSPFDLNLDNLLGSDVVAPPEEVLVSKRSSIIDSAEESKSDEKAGDASLDKATFNNLLGKIANEIADPSLTEPSLGTEEEVVRAKEEVVVPEVETETPEEVEVPAYENVETEIEIETSVGVTDVQERNYEEAASEVEVSIPKMSEVDVAPEMSEVDVPDNLVNGHGNEVATGRSVDVSSAKLEPVYDFWNDENQDHTFHFGEPWKGEIKGKVQFLAYTKEAPNTVPVYKFWNGANSEYTTHRGVAWEDEVNQGVAFYAFADGEKDSKLIPINVYWDEAKKSHTFHTGDPWTGEVDKDMIAFYASPTK